MYRKNSIITALNSFKADLTKILPQVIFGEYTVIELVETLSLKHVNLEMASAYELVQITLIYNLATESVSFKSLVMLIRLLFNYADSSSNIGLAKALIANSIRSIPEVLEMISVEDPTVDHQAKDRMCDNILNSIRDLCVADAQDSMVWNDIQSSSSFRELVSYREANFQRKTDSNLRMVIKSLFLRANLQAVYGDCTSNQFFEETLASLQTYQLSKEEHLINDIPVDMIGSLIERVSSATEKPNLRSRLWYNLLFATDIILSLVTASPALPLRLAITRSITTLLRYRHPIEEIQTPEKLQDLLLLLSKHSTKLSTFKEAGFLPAMVSLKYLVSEVFSLQDTCKADLVGALDTLISKLTASSTRRQQIVAVIASLGIGDKHKDSELRRSDSEILIARESLFIDLNDNFNLLMEDPNPDLLHCVSDWACFKLKSIYEEYMQEDKWKEKSDLSVFENLLTVPKTLLFFLKQRSSYNCAFQYFDSIRHNLCMIQSLIVSILPIKRIKANQSSIMTSMLASCFQRDKPAGDIEVVSFLPSKS